MTRHLERVRNKAITGAGAAETRRLGASAGKTRAKIHLTASALAFATRRSFASASQQKTPKNAPPSLCTGGVSQANPPQPSSIAPRLEQRKTSQAYPRTTHRQKAKTHSTISPLAE